jgi:translation initiation factor IF-1
VGTLVTPLVLFFSNHKIKHKWIIISTHVTLVTPLDTFKIESLNIRNNLNHIQKNINIHIIHIIQKDIVVQTFCRPLSSSNQS